MPAESERLLNAQNCVNIHLRRTGRVVSNFYNDIMKPSGLHGNQFLLLVPVYLRPGITISQLAQQADLDRTTLARNLKLLEQRGLISLSPGKDQRTRTIEITAPGREKLLAALPLWEQAQQRINEFLGERLACFNQSLERLDQLTAEDDRFTAD